MLTVFRAAVVTVLSLLLVEFIPGTFAGQGTEPPKFSFRSLDGGVVTEADLRGKVAVLMFTASWLPITKWQSASVSRLTAEFAPRGVAFYLIFIDSESPRSKNYASDERLREFARKRRLRLPLLRDPEAETVRKYDREQIPLIVVLDRQGHVDGRPLEGFGPEGDLEHNLGNQLWRLTR
jgi:peroxiredoxin